MNPLAWSSLALGVVLLPGVDPVLERARGLGAHGRLAAPPAVRRQPRIPRPELLAAAASVVLTVSILVRAGPVLALASGVLCASVARTAIGARRRRGVLRRDANLLAALRLVSAELDAGASPGAALSAAATVAPGHAGALLAAAEACRVGRDPPWQDCELRGVAAAWRVAAVTGAPLSGVLTRVADDLAARQDQRRAVTAAVAGARASAGLLAVLPAVGIALGAAMQAHPLHVLFATPGGRLLCLSGVVLDAAGLAWTQRLAAHAEQP